MFNKLYQYQPPFVQPFSTYNDCADIVAIKIIKKKI